MIEFILYVKNQQMSAEFYSKLLMMEPILDEPGMTEFQLAESVKLGIMPEDGIYKILQDKTSHPKSANGAPRCEIYLNVKNPDEYLERAVLHGAILIDDCKERGWGATVGYCADLDGHILAFAKRVSE